MVNLEGLGIAIPEPKGSEKGRSNSKDGELRDHYHQTRSNEEFSSEQNQLILIPRISDKKNGKVF